MALQDLNENINRRDYDGGKDFHTRYDPETASGTGKITFDEGPWDAPQKSVRPTFRKRIFGFLKRNRKKILYSFAGFLVVAIAVGVVFSRPLLFSEGRVTAELVGPTDVASAESVSYPVHWSNDNVLGARNLEILITFPQEFRPDAAPGMTVSGNTATIAVGDVESRSSGDVNFSGKFYGSRGAHVSFRTVVRFTPVGLSGRFESESVFAVSIVASPLSLDVTAPQEATSGGGVEYVVTYRNNGDTVSQNLRVKLTYPEGFRFDQADPTPVDGDSVFKVGQLSPNSGGAIRVKGALTGSNDQSRTVVAEIGIPQGDGSFLSYDRKERLTRVIVPPLSISQTVNGKTDLVASPGETLSYEIGYENSGSGALRDVTVAMEVSPDLLDVSRLSFDNGNGGSYDSEKKTIAWKAVAIPALARLEPKQKGMIRFSVPIRSDIAPGKGLVARTVVSIDSPDIPTRTGTDRFVANSSLGVRIGADARLDASVSYVNAAFPGYGPIPPKVGQETGYVIRFLVTNSLNDLSGVKVTATIPSGVKYAGKKFPDSEQVAYDGQSGKLVWDIGAMKGGEKTTRELVVPVSIVPGPDLVGKQPVLLQDAVLEGSDLFTKNPIGMSSGPKTTTVQDGSGMPPGGRGDTVIQ